jgi:hypothetical protein
MSTFQIEPPEDDEDFPAAYRELVEPSQPTPKAIRAWALQKGLPVGKRGRIPSDVVLAYQESTRS